MSWETDRLSRLCRDVRNGTETAEINCSCPGHFHHGFCQPAGYGNKSYMLRRNEKRLKCVSHCLFKANEVDLSGLDLYWEQVMKAHCFPDGHHATCLPQ